MRKHILLSGYYGYDNAGDEAVCAAVLQALRTHAGDPIVTVLSGDPALTERLHGASAVPRKRILEELPQADALIQGGGSLLQDATSALSTFYYLWVIMAARLIRKPVFLYAQGIGPLTRPPVRAAVRCVLNRVQAISVRDQDSRHLLENLGVCRPPVYLTADPVWALEPASAERAAILWERQGFPLHGKTVAFAMRTWPSAPRISQIAAQAAAALQAEGFDAVMLPMQRPVDEDQANAIAAMMPAPAPVLHGGYAPGDLMALAGRANFLIAMRLHALIFAAVCGIPCLALSYDPKVSSLAAELGIPSLDVSSLTTEALLSAFHAAWAKRAESTSRLAREASRLRDSALSTARLAKEFLDRIPSC